MNFSESGASKLSAAFASTTSVPAMTFASSWARSRVLVLGLLLGGLAAIGVAASMPRADETARKAKVLLMDRQFKDAAELLAQDPGTGDDAATRRFLRGHALLMAGDATGAADAFESYGKEFPAGADATRARLALAAAKRAQKEFALAAAIDRDQLKALLSPARRLELAKVYLDYAEKAEKGPEPVWTRARTFFDLALSLELPPADDARVREKAAEMSEKAGDLPDALTRMRAVKQAHGDGKDGIVRFRIGELERLTGDVRGARRTYQDFLRDFSKSEKAPKAAYGIALSHGMPTPGDDEALARGVAAAKAVISQFPAASEARDAAFAIAQAELHRKRFDEAVRDLQAFVSSTAQDQAAKDPRVATARAWVGDALAAQARYAEAIEAWQLYLREHPTHGEFARVHRAIVDAEHATAMAAVKEAMESLEKAKELGDRARAALLAFLGAHPLDNRQAAASLWLGSIEEARERYDVARDEYAKLASKYAGTREASEAQFRVGRLYEDKMFDFEKALTEYGKVQGPFADQARRRIAALKEKSLSVATKRTYQTDEEPSVEITSRNLEKVRVRVFHLDLEAFFRAKLASPAIESLDVEVIAPDAQREVPTSPYVPHQQTTRPIALAELRGKPGAYVVKVDGGELEATTLVLVSDLVLISKAGRRDALVFAQNARTGEPMPGVRVVASDGSKVLFEENTGADGVLLKRDDAIAGAGRLVLYGSSAGGAAVVGLDFSSLGAAAALTARGLLVTDRASYRPGETVRAWGVLRTVKDGSYAVEEGRKVRTVLRDAAGAELASVVGALSAFGTTKAELMIPGAAALGTWSAAILDAASGEVLAAKSVDVEEVRRERLRVLVELDRAVVMRGETVKATIRASYFSGGPLAKRALMVQPPGADPLTLTTDEKGEATCTIETRDLAEEGTQIVSARLAEEPVFGAAELVVATVEFRPSVSLLQPVALAGEGFDVTVETKNVAKKPVGAELKLNILRREEKGLRKVEEKAIQTEKDSGKAVTRVTLAKGGRYVLRAEGADRFGTAVVGEAEVEISGDDDSRKLRFFLERDEWKLGEAMRARVISRMGAERSALVTTEGAGILAYRIVKIPKGESAVEWTIDETLAPQATLAMAAVDAWKLHVAAKKVTVSKDLRVEVKAPSAPVKPGTEVALDVTVRDARGNPVATDVLLSVVDSAFLAMRPDNTPSLTEHFFSARRDAGTVAASSCGFEYRPSTRKVASDLAAEEERKRQAPAPAPAAPGGDPAAFALDDAKKSEDVLGGLAKEKDSGPRIYKLTIPSEGKSDESAELGEELTDKLAAVGYVATGGGGGGKGGQFAGRAGGSPTRGARVRQSLKPGANPVSAGEPGGPDAYYFGFAGGGEVLNLGRGFFETGGLPGWGESNGALADPIRREFAATAAFLTVVTTTDGVGKLVVKSPDSSTEWTVRARGVSRATELGEAKATYIARRELEATLRLPGAFAEGDRIDSVGLVRNVGTEKRSVETKLTLTGASGGGDGTLELDGGEEESLPRPITIGADPTVKLSMSARAGSESDGVERELAVRPAGTQYTDRDAAVVRDAASLKVTLPSFAELRRPTLAITVGPPLETEVMHDPLLRPLVDRGCVIFPDSLGWTVTRGVVALERWSFLGRVGGADDAAQARQRQRAAEAVARLVSEQAEDGGFGWAGIKSSSLSMQADQRGRYSDLATSARAMGFLARARAAGIVVPEATMERGQRWLRERLRGDVSSTDRARIALALAEGGSQDFELVNRLQRGKSELTDSGAALLVLADLRMGRRDLAAEAADEVRRRAKRQGDKLTFAVKPEPAADAMEAAGLSILALAQVDPKDPLLAPAVESLRAARQAGLSDRAEAAAVAALAAYHSITKTQAAEFELTLTLNGEPLRTVRSSELASPLGFEVEASKIRAENRIDAQIRGRGEASVQAVFTAVASKFDPAARKRFATVSRSVEPAVITYHGKEIPRGFSVVDGPYSTFRNELKNVVSGSEVQVSIWFATREKESQQMDYAVLEEPIPAGCEVVPGSLSGSFERAIVRDGAIIAAFPARQTNGSFNYRLLGARAGDYLYAPAVVRALYSPERTSEGEDRRLKVLPFGTVSPDETRLTPDELYHLGVARYDAGERKEGAELLRQAVKEWRLREEPLKEASRRILLEAMDRGDAPEAIAAFERLRDRFPEVILPFETVLKVGESYLAASQAELADLLFRGTMSALFRREANVAGALLKEGEFLAAVDFLEGLHRVYPDLPEMLQALHQLAGLVVSAAADGSAKSPDGRVLAKDGLLGRAGQIELEFLVRSPQDPVAPEAAFGFLSTQLDRGVYSGVVEGCAAFARRYAESPLLDQVLALEGYARFASGDPKGALAVLDRVVNEQFPDGRGARKPSTQKDRAVFLKAQILHATGDARGAVAEYEKVQQMFSDAADALASFRRRKLELPSSISVAGSDPVSVSIQSRNLAKASMRAYRVDLMRLYLMERNLDRMTGIDLAGIAPLAEKEVALGAVDDFTDRETKVPLELPQKGAYLIVVRSTGDTSSASLAAATLALRTDLTMEVREDAAAGRVWVNVRDAKGASVPRADVRVVGSRDGSVRVGSTDLRGVFVAEGIHGKCTVVAQVVSGSDSSFAFHRGAVDLVPEPAKMKDARPMQQMADFEVQNTAEFRKVNEQVQNKNRRALEDLLNRQQEGVDLQRVK